MSRVALALLTLAVTVTFATAPGTARAQQAVVDADPTPSDETAVRVVAVADGPLDTAAERLVAGLTTRQKAAAVVMGHIPTSDPAALGDYMSSTGIGGFILMGANIPGQEAALRAVTDALTVDASLPPLIAVDQEGGDVSRLGWDDFAAAPTLKSEAPANTALAFSGRGALVMRDGIGVNFGIVADVTDDTGSFIYRRALGTTPADGAARVEAAVTGESGTALSTLKHFPGHGAAPGDSHRGIPTTAMSQEEWEATDALPFRAGIDAGAPLLMFGHLAYTGVDDAPASLSATWHRIARESLGFDGVAITDDLGMLQASGIESYQDPVANAVSALAAGNDMVLTVMFSDASTAPRIVDGVVAAIEDGRLAPERLDEAAVRVTELRLRLAASGGSLTPCDECTPAT